MENHLPKSWCLKPIVELLSCNSNGRPFQQGWSPQCENHPADVNSWGVLKTTAIQDGNFLDFENKKLPENVDPRPHLEVLAGDILMTCAGPRNRCGIVSFVKKTRSKLLMSGKMYRFRPDIRLLNAKYLEAFIRSYDAQLAIDSMKTGISDSGLNLTHGRFSELLVPFAPLNEQKRIVTKIEELFSELDSGIASLKTAQEKLKVYRQAVLKHAFEGKLTAQWREENKDKLEAPEQLLARIQQERETRYQEQLAEWEKAVEKWEESGKEGKKPSKPKALIAINELSLEISKHLPKLPKTWFWNKLAHITTGVEYGTSAKSAESGQVPVIRMGNMQNGKIDWTDLVYTSDKEEIEKYTLATNDVLFNRTNSPELVGKTAKYKGEQPALFAGYLIRVNQIESIALADYVNYFLNSHIAKQYGNSVKTDGVNQSNINGEKLQNYPFPFCSISEQAVIVDMLEEKLSLTDASIHDIELQLAKAEILRQSILKKAFSGQLVPQDPNDEPASELLARIQAEKATIQEQAKPAPMKRGRKVKETANG